jgi:hypothetical protein
LLSCALLSNPNAGNTGIVSILVLRAEAIETKVETRVVIFLYVIFLTDKKKNMPLE